MHRLLHFLSRIFYSGCVLFSLTLPILPGWGAPGRQVSAPAVAITAPQDGQALQGAVTITGSAAAEGFQSAELSFAYAADGAQTWFLISEIASPVTDGVLGQWDTTAISDGVYTLRLAVTLQDGQQVTAQVSQLRVRNYSPVETDTPTPLPPTVTPLPSGTPLPTVTPTLTVTPAPSATPMTPTATLLPTNAARLSRQALVSSLGQGALAAVGLLSMLGVYGLARTLLRHGQ